MHRRFRSVVVITSASHYGLEPVPYDAVRKVASSSPVSRSFQFAPSQSYRVKALDPGKTHLSNRLRMAMKNLKTVKKGFGINSKVSAISLEPDCNKQPSAKFKAKQTILRAKHFRQKEKKKTIFSIADISVFCAEAAAKQRKYCITRAVD